VAVEPSDRREGRAAVTRACVESPQGFGTLMQEVLPDDYRGKRVRLAAWVRTEAVTRWCGLWMRVDGANKRVLAFDNMESRPIRGTAGWTRHEVVLDVAAEAELVAFGVILDGTGAAWIDEVTFEVVGTDVPTTGQGFPAASRIPRNLDFAQG
jgi:hypothetical protein